MLGTRPRARPTGRCAAHDLRPSELSVELAAAAAAVEADRGAGLRCHEVLALVVTDDEAATRASAERLADAARVMDAELPIQEILQRLYTSAAPYWI